MRRTIVAPLVLLLLTPPGADGQEGFLTTNGVSLHYEVRGEGPAVVLLHGWANSLESWQFLSADLAPHYRVVRYDRRGFGHSSGSPDGSLDPLDLEVLLDSLGIEKAVVVGHSQGAVSALRFALAFPTRLEGLVLFGCASLSGFGLPFNGPDAFPSGYVQVAREFGLDSMRSLFYAHPISDGFVEGSEGYEVGRAMFGAYQGRDLLDPKPSANATPAADVKRLGEVQVPTLVINGERELPYFLIVAEVLAYGIPGAERQVVPGGGHSVQLQQPARFNAAIERFLARVYGPVG